MEIVTFCCIHSFCLLYYRLVAILRIESSRLFKGFGKRQCLDYSDRALTKGLYFLTQVLVLLGMHYQGQWNGAGDVAFLQSRGALLQGIGTEALIDSIEK